jgi:large subunit ribosomal protein L24
MSANSKAVKPKFKIKRDDQVVVIAGKHKGSTGRVLKVLPEVQSVVVENVNLVKRHVKASQGQAGRIVQKESPLHISNVSLWNAAESKRVKARWSITDGTDGKTVKVRVDRKTGAPVDG